MTYVKTNHKQKKCSVSMRRTKRKA